MHTSTSLEPAGHSPPSVAPTRVLHLRTLGSILRRNLLLILGITGAAIIIAVIATRLQDRVYESEATLQIEGEQQKTAQFTELLSAAGLGSVPGTGNTLVATAIPVLESRRLAERVVDSLALQIQLREPDLSRREVFSRIEMPETVELASEAVFELDRDQNGSYTLRAPGTESGLLVQLGKPFTASGIALSLNPDLRSAPPDHIRFAIRPFRRAVASLREDLEVSQYSGAQILSIRYRSNDPILAAAVPNALTTKFVQYHSQTSASETQNTVQFLREQVDLYRQELGASENRLQQFREQAQVVNLPQEASEQVRRLATLQASRDELLTERQALTDLLTRVRTEHSERGGSSPYRKLASFPVFFSNPAVQNILRSLIQLEDQRAELLVLRTLQSEDVKGIDQRIGELELQLYQIAQNYLQSREAELASLDQALARFTDRLGGVPEREIEFARLERQTKLLEEIYTMLQTRLKDAEIQEAAEPNDIQVLDAALVPETPISPRPLINLGLAVVLGLMMSVGVVFVREVLDTKVRDEDDLQAITTGVPILGAIPRMGIPLLRERSETHRRLGASTSRNSAARPGLITQTAPDSAAAEAFRALRTHIAFASPPDATPQVLVFSSAMSGDGKSVTVANLAVSFAQQGTRTLLIDCDLRGGSLHESFEVPEGPGLTEVITRGLPFSEAVREVASYNSAASLFFLSTGVRPTHPAELIGSQQMRALLDELRAQFELIVLDTPPLSLVTDAAILSTAADATILVARAGTTSKEALRFAASQLQQLRIPLQGLVLNGVEAGGLLYGGYAQRNGKEAIQGADAHSA